MESSTQFAVLKVMYYANGIRTMSFSISGPKFLSDRIKSMLKNTNIVHEWRTEHRGAEICVSMVEVHTLLNWIKSSSPGWLLQTMSSSMTDTWKEDTFLFKSKE